MNPAARETSDVAPKRRDSWRQEQDDHVFPSTPVATPNSHRKKLAEEGSGEGGGWGGVWEESFNRWVVLEEETLHEARKTEQLAFLPLEAIKVRFELT